VTDPKCSPGQEVAANREALDYRDYYEDEFFAALAPDRQRPGNRQGREEPGSRRDPRRLLVVCLGYGEHPDADLHRYWYNKINSSNAAGFRYVYLQLTPKPKDYNPYEFFFKPYSFDQASPNFPTWWGVARGNAFDQVRFPRMEADQVYHYGGKWNPDQAVLPINAFGEESEAKLEPFVSLPAGTTDYYDWLSRYYDFKKYTVKSSVADFSSFTPQPLAEFTKAIPLGASVLGRLYTREEIDLLGATWYEINDEQNRAMLKSEKTYLLPFLSVAGRIVDQRFRFALFDVNGTTTLQKAIEGALGHSVSGYDKVVVEAGALYRDHYIAADNGLNFANWLSGIGGLGPTSLREPELLERGSINLLPALARLGTDLVSSGFETRSGFDKTSIKTVGSTWTDAPFMGVPSLPFQDQEEEHIAREILRTAFDQVWPAVIGFGPQTSELLPRDPWLQPPLAAQYGAAVDLFTAVASDPSLVRKKVAVLVPINVGNYGGSQWFTAGDQGDLAELSTAKKQRKTSDMFNPFMRCYRYINDMTAWQLF
jgi:hypothetical protein